jgi:hypothetical protein
MVFFSLVNKEVASKSILSNFIHTPQFEIKIDNFSYTILSIVSKDCEIVMTDFKNSINIKFDTFSIELPHYFPISELAECIENELDLLEPFYKLEKKHQYSVKIIQATHRFLKR